MPALSGFISEALCFIGGFSAFRLVTAIGTLGILLGAVYLLRAYQRVFLGPLNKSYDKLIDINSRELATVVPIAFLVLLFGVFPKPLVDMVSSSISSLVSIIQGAM